MSQQLINIGNAPNDASGDTLRVAFDKSNDNFTELYNRVQTLESDQITPASITRSKLIVECDGTVGQVILFDTQFVPDYAIIPIDYDNRVVAITDHDENGFTITSLYAGHFGYIAMVEIT